MARYGARDSALSDMVPSLVLSEAVLLLVLVLDVKISLRRPSLGVACVRPGVRGRKSRPEHNGEYEYRCAEYEYEYEQELLCDRETPGA